MINYKRYIPYLLSLLIVLVNTQLWESIKLPYSNPNNIIGIYSIEKYHVFNDTLRFLIYLIFPLLVFFFSYIFLNKLKFRDFFLFLKLNNNFQINEARNLIIYAIIILLTIFSYASISLPLYKLDIFHEGQLLSAYLNLELKNKFWLGSFLNTGLFFDQLNTYFAFKVFGVETVGVYRIFQIILEIFTIPFIIFFCFSIVKHFNFENNLNWKISLILILLGIFLLKNGSFYYRHIPIFIFLTLLNEIILDPKKNINYILIGIICSFSFLWSIDVAAYINISLLFLILFLSINKKYQSIFFIILSIIIFWFVFYFLLGEAEFNAFMHNTLEQYKYNEYYNGIIHPEPFSSEKNSTRGTKALILFILNGILILRELLIKNNNKLSNSFLIFLVFFYVLSIFNYKSGLSRSDGGHIDIGSSFTLFLFLIIVVLKFSIFWREKILVSKKINNIILKTLFYSIMIFLIKISMFNNDNSFSNIKNFKTNLNKFINYKDDYFLTNEYINLKNYLIKLTKDEECFQTFNYEPTIYYLINKKSCTKYYKLMSIASVDEQRIFVSELKYSRPKFILINGNYDEWGIEPDFRFFIISKYINKVYKKYISFNNHDILILNEK